MTIEAWLRKTRRRNLLAAALLGSFALAVGACLFALTSWLGWLAVQALLAGVLANWNAALRASLVLTPLLIAVSLVDAARCDRDDVSLFPLWALREFLHCGPWAMRDGGKSLWRAARLAQLDVPACAKVLALLAARRNSVSTEELQQRLPELNWTALSSQLRLIEGVLLLRRDNSHIVLTEPLRWRLRGMKLARPAEPLRVTVEPEPAPVIEPENLQPHELLGVSPNASLQEIKTAYRTRIKECHPDRFPAMDPTAREQAERWSKLLNAAYRTLLDQRTAR